MKKLHPLKLKRLERGLSQYELSFLTGIPQPKICYTEKGLSVLREDQKKLIAKVLKVQKNDIWPDNSELKGSIILTDFSREV